VPGVLAQSPWREFLETPDEVPKTRAAGRRSIPSD